MIFQTNYNQGRDFIRPGRERNVQEENGEMGMEE
jgi:hypothetical protein